MFPPYLREKIAHQHTITMEAIWRWQLQPTYTIALDQIFFFLTLEIYEKKRQVNITYVDGRILYLTKNMTHI